MHIRGNLFSLIYDFFRYFWNLFYRILIFLGFNRQVRTLKRYAHSNYNTTANIYAHLDSSSMEQSGIAISNILSIKNEKEVVA